MIRILCLLSVLFTIGCKTESTPVSKGLPPDFEEFYRVFHQDSLYQIEHIRFPLKGLPDYAGEEAVTGDGFHWEKEAWKMHRPMDPQISDFTRQLEVVEDFMVIERWRHRQQALGMERRFTKLGDEWYLIYYAGINQFQAKTPADQ
jgi:hypothetical protein